MYKDAVVFVLDMAGLLRFTKLLAVYIVVRSGLARSVAAVLMDHHWTDEAVLR